jgi:hypothetical protein
MAIRERKMVEVRGEASNRNPHLGLAGGKVQRKMVDVTPSDSNLILETLEEWNTVLEDCDAPYPDFTPN